VYALGHVARLLGRKIVADITEVTVLRYQEDRLREKAAPKSINEEVRFLLKMLGDPGEVIRAHLKKTKQLKLTVHKNIGKAFDSDETEGLATKAKSSRSPHMYRWRYDRLVNQKQLRVMQKKERAGVFLWNQSVDRTRRFQTLLRIGLASY
jgi:hypothetical protein